ncbi:hypothetical protein DY120_01745 [Apilactobacillus micheneri]|uniref:Uncharacterized protein n=1 Tax=Apilactobacillus micheneri TaxID=1899430 RepID=A0ABY2Z413_9LACO|nr:hypothetical protein [Apilactobacillus micheneri]TPR26442.1 hypothetical protein DY114_01745 [Apilactobacillus micheneri]TPR27196.1 hypothetical protein DY111_01745 [Apilactobacillus micheneri]TPR27443.1 hypothetical protein DY113_06695 [Apilactobacillus micheneri]TPR31959.1 hypothetical protein DY117_01745 [Apilactobacillus micheneri]TPR32363.1 hypothetical protein DY120_01745 [Apilactobacillus micheneri]
MKKQFIKISAALLALITTTTAFSSINANAKTVDYKRAPKEYAAKTITKNKTWANRLNKDGYTFRIKNDPNYYKDDFSKNIKGDKLVNYSNKDTKNFAQKGINFKVNHIWSYKNGLAANIVSQSGKINGWIGYTSIYNKQTSNKKFKNLMNIENKICDQAEDLTFYKYEGKNIHDQKISKLNTSINKDLKDAKKDANKLTGNDKKLAEQSIKETKTFIKNSDIRNLPTLLVGRM